MSAFSKAKFSFGSFAVALSMILTTSAVKNFQARVLARNSVWRPDSNELFGVVFDLLLFSPAIETLIFLILGRFFRDWNSRAAAPCFVLFMALIGYVAHWNANGASIGGALGFAILAAWFWAVATRIGHRWSYVFTTLAHSFANAPFAAIAIATATTA